jgi:hypothetical protein
MERQERQLRGICNPQAVSTALNTKFDAAQEVKQRQVPRKTELLQPTDYPPTVPLRGNRAGKRLANLKDLRVAIHFHGDHGRLRNLK